MITTLPIKFQSKSGVSFGLLFYILKTVKATAKINFFPIRRIQKKSLKNATVAAARIESVKVGGDPVNHPAAIRQNRRFRLIRFRLVPDDKIDRKFIRVASTDHHVPVHLEKSPYNHCAVASSLGS